MADRRAGHGAGVADWERPASGSKVERPMDDDLPRDEPLQRQLRDLLPRASAWDRRWVEANSLGENVLHLAESLIQVMPLRPGMRVLDLGCGHAVSSIFLARELGVQVWAVDRGVDPSANLARVIEQGCEGAVFPVRADARDLPFPHGFFDAVVAFDSYLYFGTDDRYLSLLAPLIRPGGLLGIVDAFIDEEIRSFEQLPEDMRQTWSHDDWYLVHSIEWWRWHWQKTGLVDVRCAEPVPASRQIMASYIEQYRDDPDEADFIAFVRSDFGRRFGTFRMFATRTDVPVHLEDEDGDVPY
jgi:cyclopropane fatty-acyl-phospholipid synthase-like methyltransferase